MKIFKKIFLPIFFIAIILIVVLNIHSLTGSDRVENKGQYTFSFWGYGKNDHGQLSGKVSDEVVYEKMSIKSDFDIAEVYAGKSHTLALTKNGEVISWGLNDLGQLGYRTSGMDSPIPRKIKNIENIIALSTSNNHSLALDSRGKVWAWGQNFTGQLGNGNHNNSLIPILVEGLPYISTISAGHKFSLALSESGEVWAWGASCDEENKQEVQALLEKLGSNITSLKGGYYDKGSSGESTYDAVQDCIYEDVIKIKSLVPIKLPEENITQISVGYGHALLLTKEGQVIAFGCNLYRQVGYEPGTRKGEWLKEVIGLKDIVAVAAGARHSIALDKNGDVYAFGANFSFQLASGKSKSRSTAEKINGLPPIKKIYASFDYSIAIANDGSVWMWGGDVENLPIPNIPGMPTKIGNITSEHVATGGAHIIFEY